MFIQDSDKQNKISCLTEVIIFLGSLVSGIVVNHFWGFWKGAIVFIGFWIFIRSELSRKKTKEDILYEKEAQFEKVLLRPYSKYIKYSLIIVGVLNIPLYFWSGTIFIPLVFDTLYMLAYVFFLGALAKKAHSQTRESIALEKGFTFSPQGDVLSLQEKLRTSWENVQIANIFSGMYEKYPVRIFDFSCQWTKHGLYSTTICEITNGRRCPNMLIISKQGIFRETFDMEKIFPGISVRLEGNFSNYFSLFVEQGAEDDIRQFLTPDVMALFIDDMPDISFLFFDEKVYIVLPDNGGYFLKDYFVEQVNKAQFILTKWAPVLAKIDSVSK